MGRFTDKVVIVTGAGSGIGAATAWRFGAEGAQVVLAGRRRDKLDDVATALDPACALVHPADVADAASVRALIDAAVARFGGIDVLVNNAGVANFGPFATAPEEQWHTTLQINLGGVFNTCRAAIPHLLARGGSIVNVSSVSGMRGDWGLSFYNASKGAVGNLTRGMALELGGKGVRVNAVAPSLTLTEMAADLVADPAIMAKFADRIPMGRGARPEEIAAVIAFLASADASFVNGVILPVDGGVSASSGQPRMTE